MKVPYSLILAFLFLTVGANSRADTIEYSFSIQNAPGMDADFSWTVEHDGFITFSPPINDQFGHCLNCDANFFAPSTVMNPVAAGCSIYKVYIAPNQSLITYFAPFCDGLYDATFAGGLPEPGIMGSFEWQGGNPDGTIDLVTLSVEDLQAPVPEPSSLGLLLAGGALIMAFAKRFRVLGLDSRRRG